MMGPYMRIVAYIFPIKSLKSEILFQSLNHQFSGHINARKTIGLIAREIYWMNLYRDVFHISQFSDYCSACLISSQELCRPRPVLKGDTANADEGD